MLSCCQIFRQSWNLHKTQLQEERALKNRGCINSRTSGYPIFRQKKPAARSTFPAILCLLELRNVPRIVVGLLKTRGCLQKMYAVCHRNPRLDR